MVEVKEMLYLEAEEFFQCLGESIAYDISEATGKKIRPKQISNGYTYKKIMKNKVGRKGQVDVTITNFESPTLYRAEFKYYSGVNILSYAVEEFEKGRIGVTYVEDFIGASKAKNANGKLMNFFYQRKAKKRAIRMLRAIEDYAKQQRINKQSLEETVAS